MTIIYGLLCLGFIICFHELGHFVAARLCGVTVESFSIGMGPVLLHKTVKSTDYRLSLFPIGGYCGMKGEKDLSKALENNLSEITGEKDSLYGISAVKRACIAFAGPFANLFFAFIAFTAVAMIGYTYYSPSAEIQLADEVYPQVHSAARDGGLLTGDVILSINNKKITDFSDIAEQVSTHPDESLSFTVKRGTDIISFTVHTELDKSEGIGRIGVISKPGSIQKREAPTYSFFPALLQGVKETGSMVYLTIKSIGILFKGIDVTNAVSGPARVTAMLGDTVKEGFSASIRSGVTSTLQFLSLISISLFVLNLLPIPVLDGGLILFSVIEFFFHRQVPPKIQYYVQYIGIAFIACMFILGLTGDIRYFASILGKK